MERTPYLTSMHAPDLASAIARTHEGQASWAGWQAPDEFCGECRFFARGKDWVPRAECTKRRRLDPKHQQGKRVPCTARACRYWEPRSTE